MAFQPDKEPHERWFSPGTGIGLLAGLVLGLLLGDVVLGLIIGIIFGAGIGVMTSQRDSGRGEQRPREDRRRGGARRRDPRDSDQGALERGLLWLLAGLVALLGLVASSAPELLMADPVLLGQLLGLAVLAAVPGVAVLVVLAVRRHRADDEEA